MAEGDFQLGIPGAGASDFATTPIPSINFIDCWTPDGGFPTRGEIGYATLADRSNWGTAQITGPAYGVRYIWPVAAMLTQAQARQLGALAKWQSLGYQGLTNAEAPTTRVARPLRLVDEIEYLDSEPTPHSRTLLSSIQESWNSDYVYGYGVFEVFVQLPQDWRQLVGRWQHSGDQARLVTFTLVEI